jgi:hypothetical protein
LHFDSDNSEASYLFDVSEVPEIHYLKKGSFKNSVEEVMCWFLYGTCVLRDLKPDITIMNGVVPCWSPGIRIVVSHGLRTGGHYPLTQKLYDFLMYRMKGPVVAVSQPLKKEILRELGFGTVKVIPIGLDKDILAFL